MMKKKMAVLAALIIIIHGFPVEAAAAEHNGDVSEKGVVSTVENGESSDGVLEAGGGGNRVKSEETMPWLDNEDRDSTAWTGVSVSGQMIPVSGQVIPGTEAAKYGKEENDPLLVPSEIHVVIDPWEIDGKGQLYSERYVIQNNGTETGTLLLSHPMCFSNGEDEAIVKTDREEIHSGQEKSVCVEMVFENEDRMFFGREDLSQDNIVYEIKLEPKEKLVFWFEGEVNEYAAQPWQDGDITVALDYSWKEGVEEVPGEISAEGEDVAAGQEKAGEGELAGDAGEAGANGGDALTEIEKADSKDTPLGTEEEEGKEVSVGAEKEDGKDVPAGTEKEDEKSAMAGTEYPDGAGNSLGLKTEGDIQQKDIGKDTDVEEGGNGNAG